LKKSKLLGFTLRLKVSLANGLLGGYYIERIGDDRYGLFGFGIYVDKEEAITEKASLEPVSSLHSAAKSEVAS
jgi:hypothetical protein